MTSRERLTVAARGGRPDRKPVIVWPGRDDRSDVIVAAPNEVEQALATHPDQAVLAEIVSPFGRAVQFQLPLSTLLREQPDRGQQELDRLAAVTRQDIEQAILSGADGIFYRLIGANPQHSTPMEYGGFYLERDRELLEEVSGARLNVVYVESGPEPYLEFVSDLPSHLFAWDIEHNSDVSALRQLRGGALAAYSSEADVVLTDDFDAVTRWIQPAGDLASA